MMLQSFIGLLLQFLFFSLASAAPVTTQGNNTVGYGAGGGVVGFVVLVLDIIVFIEVLKSNRPVANKVLWCLLVFFFPIVGILIYFFFSNRAQHNSSGYEAIGS
ncbi:hypothetical protein M011DRAFT_488061 [Sporormia fimetaria CBS 119925]|uniref:Cardiolipin synthase N-terminal domain-containing protein n=1 Tax=Sporormia fimetaria CBS 119925 TaxID=1340428 RepID=A0A6A6V4A1_9PLEO|nr:hypothetical protein M011DRAFT_488061 [Sporormia fimetaria CBS 119925]